MLAVFPHENADMNLSHVCKQMTYMGWNTVAPGGGGGRGGAGEGLLPAVKFWLSQAFVQHRMDLTLKGSKDFVAVFLPFHKTTSGYCCIFKKQINGLTKSNNIFLSVTHKVIVIFENTQDPTRCFLLEITLQWWALWLQILNDFIYFLGLRYMLVGT